MKATFTSTTGKQSAAIDVNSCKKEDLQYLLDMSSGTPMYAKVHAAYVRRFGK